jgi:hypothetical protein
LERHHYPRLAMCAVLASGGLAGFLTSAVLLAAGLRSMAWRYGLAALVGYGIFLLGLRLWLSLHGRQRPKLEDAADALDLAPTPGAEPSAASEGAPEFQFGGGGGFSGGGAGGTFDSAGISDAAAAAEVASGASGTGDVADAVSALDEGAAIVIPVLIVSFVVVGLVGVVTVLVGAPGLLAELLLDGLIAGTAYRRLRQVPVQHWLHGAVRRTWKPMLALTLTLVIAGLVAQQLTPAADSIGDLLRAIDHGAVSPNLRTQLTSRRARGLRPGSTLAERALDRRLVRPGADSPRLMRVSLGRLTTRLPDRPPES